MSNRTIVMSNRTIVKKIVLGTPVRGVTASSSISTISEFDVANRSNGDYLVYDSASGKYISQYVQILDSADVAMIAGSLEGLDSDAVRDLVDSDYIQLRQDFSYGSLTDAPDFTSLTTDLIPDSTGTRSLGTFTKKWKDLFVGANSFYIGNLKLSDDNGSLRIVTVDNTGQEEDVLGNISGGDGGISSQNLSNTIDSDLSGTNEQTIDTFSASKQRSAKYFIQLEDNTSNEFGVAEVLLIHDSSDVYIQEYAKTFTGADLGTFDASLNDSTVSLLFTPTSSTISVKAKRLINGI